MQVVARRLAERLDQVEVPGRHPVEAAERLRVRPTYVRELVAKGRLTFVHGEQLDAAEVEQLAKLMNKLRHEGLATLVQISGEETKP